MCKVPNGSLLAVFEAEDSSVSGRFSDNGDIWSEPFNITLQPENTKTQYSADPCALLTVEKKVIMFYVRYVNYSIQEPEINNCSIWKVESYDNGVTWKNDICIYDKKNYSIGSYGALMMLNGTIIYPFSWTEGDNFWEVAMLRSDDNGKSWYCGEKVPDQELMGTEGLDEPSVAELSDSGLYCLMRSTSKNYKNIYSTSSDCGLTWSNPNYVEEMNCSDTTSAIYRVSWIPNIVVATWISRYDNWYYVPRMPLVIAYSNDDCKTWSKSLVLVNDTEPRFQEGSSFGFYPEINDMSFFTSNGKIFLSYHESVAIVWNRTESMIQVFGTDIFGLNRTDFNMDGKTDRLDAIILEKVFGTQNFQCDLVSDGIINILDAIVFSNLIH